MIARFLFISFTFLVIKTYCFEVLDSNLANVKYDTNYIAKHRNKLSISVLGLTRGLNVKLYNPENDKQFINYSPNNLANIGFGFCYKWLSIETAFKSPFDNIDIKKGTTKQFSLRANLIRQKFWASLMLVNYKGFYVNNPEIFDNQWFKTNSKFPLRPDMATSTFYLVTNYVFNHRKFSIMASVNNFDQQKKSAGSVVLGGAFTRYGFNGDSSFLPKKLKTQFSGKADLRGIFTSFVGLNVGYMHTLVLKRKFFAHFAFIPSIGLKSTFYNFDNESALRKTYSIGVAADTRVSLGFNSHKAFGGFGLQNIGLNSNTEGKKIVDYGYFTVKLFYGRRFNITRNKKR